ncbi:glycosyltransferase family 2 protein [Roseixanthobacter glucoisosaccharinicivorans]|uniref:glycosyltransferase family 2 protein n=1 Tax=Roseixanthobacter glucoisosaccharinicivorans TaxID=3119923 RepID=UPI00372820D8
MIPFGGIGRGMYQFLPEDRQLAGWVIPSADAPDEAVLAVVCGDTVVNLLDAQEAPPADAPDSARGFRWEIPDLLRVKAEPIRIIDLVSGQPLEGPAILPLSLPVLQDTTTWGEEPFYWVAGISGTLHKWFNHVADGLWITAASEAAGPRYMRMDAPTGAGVSWGIQALADNEVPWAIHLRLPTCAAEIGDDFRFTLWARLSRATSNLTQCHIEIFLSRWNGQKFENLRRLRRSRAMRLFSSTDVQMTLAPEERSLAAAGELILTVISRPCFGLVICPVAPAQPVAIGDYFEDERLLGAFEACSRLTKLTNEALGRKVMMVPPPEPRPAVSPPPLKDIPLTEIILPVYNGDEIVVRCLKSLQSATDTPFHVWIVDDGSREHTSLLMEEIAAQDDRFTIHRRTINRGYTKSINEAIKLTSTEWVVILNSDTVVSKGWLRRLHQAAAQVPGAGLVGALSNAATWQSIPQAKNADGTWSQNDFIDPELIDQVQAKLEATSECLYPEFPVLNGFCTLISRAVFDACGYFDEEAFPLGYGEETDMCLRAGLAGFKLIVADNCFVYHEKSVSFGSATRSKLTRAGGFELRNKHAGVNIAALERLMQSNPVMSRLRSKLSRLESELSV